MSKNKRSKTHKIINPYKIVGKVILLGIIGFLIRDYCYDFPISYIAGTKTTLASDHIKENQYSSLFFPLIIAMIPLLYLLVKKTTNVKSKPIVIYSIIFGFGILFWVFRVKQFIARIENIHVDNNLKDINFGLYLFFGFTTGTIISIMIFRNKNNLNKRFRNIK